MACSRHQASLLCHLWFGSFLELWNLYRIYQTGTLTSHKLDMVAPPPPPRSPPSRLLVYFANVLGVKYFGLAISEGARIIFSNRKFIWLPIGYSLALYGHRYLENGILPIIAEDMFHNPAYSRILVCGSNLGELVGALTVFLFGNMVPSPIPWLRSDAFLLLLVWVLPFYRRSDPNTVYLSILPPTPP